jgi:menaquinone-9 beta-reductase
MPDIDQTASREYDVIVVGAGPAGCSAAYFSTLQGLNVLLLDKARFPRDKVCGDSISPRSLKILERMGLLENTEKL